MCFSAISFNHFKQLARYYVKLSQAKNVQDYSISVKFNGFLIGPGRKRRILSLFKKKNKNKKRWLLLWRDGRPTAGCSEKEFEARVALGCASSNSYASFVLSKLPAFLLTHEPIFNCGRYKNVFFLCCYSLTGFFIMLCFTTTKKVRGLIRDKFPKRRIRTERQTTITRFSGGTNTEMVSDSPIMKKGKIVMAWHK